MNTLNRLPISAETRRRWGRRRRIPPVPALALRLLEGNLEEISPHWAGWSLKGDTLWSPENHCWTVGKLNAWHYELQLIRQLKAELRRYTID